MTQVINFLDYKERYKLRRRHRTIYQNKLPVMDDNDLIVNSIAITKMGGGVTVALRQIDFGQDPPTADTILFSKDEIGVLIEALIEVDQCLLEEDS